MAAHSFEPDGSLHLIVREPESHDLREFWWTDTTSGSGKLTGNGVPPTVATVNEFYLGSVASYVTRADGMVGELGDVSTFPLERQERDPVQLGGLDVGQAVPDGSSGQLVAEDEVLTVGEKRS